MQQGFPITVAADGQFSSSLNPLLTQLEMWLNFQALKADWYSNEAFILSFNFTLVRSLAEKAEHLTSAQADTQAGIQAESEKGEASPAVDLEKRWRVELGYAYQYDSSKLTTTAFIAVDDLARGGVGIEQGIKARLVAVANAVAHQYGLIALIAA
ncbi:hypothetical protein [Shewanella algidipiscicola]|uniref:Uncharacterized protein n=1 Tax=Shewanella algidipiscicola TaxID=614070 RepID=A0ABQ4NTF1_9GAMM|nr:hypothetical protein [Shewanella algidipiscicola]GIU02965.1 hypothetical protein TUM4630_35770 [Shewanella algidipiscicola]